MTAGRMEADGKKDGITGKPAVLKELNISLIKDALARCGQATRVELAGMTKISQPTVNLLIRELLKDETVISLGEAASTGGRRAEVYALNRKKSAVALIAVNDGFFETSVIDMEFGEESHGRMERSRHEDCLAQMERILRKLMEDDRSIRAVSAGVPGAVSAGGVVFAVPSVPEWENFPLRTVLEERLSVPVQVTNDINASAVGYCSVHEKIRNVVYLFTDGDGIGAGIMLNGELYSGTGSFAGELGFMQLGGYSVEELMHGKGGTDGFPSLLAQIIVNLVCMLNPERVALAGHADLGRMLSGIIQECRRILPQRAIPRIDVVQDGKAYYFRGLGKLGCGLLNRDIHIV